MMYVMVVILYKLKIYMYLLLTIMMILMKKPFTISDIRINIASPVYQFNVPCRDMIFANLKFFNFKYS